MFAQDAGGARVVSPVVSRLLNCGNREVTVIAYQKSETVFWQSGIPYIRLASFGRDLPLGYDDAVDLLKQFGPDLLLAGTSHPGDYTSSHLFRGCESLSIPSLGLLDNWKGFDRFDDRSGAPGFLGVMDPETAAVLARRGFPADRLRVVGHPHLEQVYCERSRLTDPGRVRRLRAEAGIAAEDGLILLCSERLHEHALRSPCESGCRSLLRSTVGGRPLPDLLREWASQLSQRCGRSIRLLLRPHPNELSAGALSDGALRDSDAVAVADVVLGVSSFPVVQAYFVGKPVASLTFLDRWVPAQSFIDEDLFGRLEWFPVIRSWSHLETWLEKAVLDGNLTSGPSERALATVREATTRALALVEALL